MAIEIHHFMVPDNHDFVAGPITIMVSTIDTKNLNQITWKKWLLSASPCTKCRVRVKCESEIEMAPKLGMSLLRACSAEDKTRPMITGGTEQINSSECRIINQDVSVDLTSFIEP